MRERLFRGDVFEPERSRRADFDPIAEGKRYDLAPEVSAALWEHVRRETTSSDGLCDENAARARFAQLAERIARRGGQLGPEPFHWTQVDVALGRLPSDNLLAEQERVPGRTTLVLAEASARARVALGGVPDRMTLIASHVASDTGSLDESREFFLRYVSGGHAARTKLERAIAALDHHAAVIATSALKQELASAQRHLANGLESDEGLRAELAALEGPAEQLLAKLPSMSAGGRPWELWGPSSAEWRAVIDGDAERANGLPPASTHLDEPRAPQQLPVSLQGRREHAYGRRFDEEGRDTDNAPERSAPPGAVAYDWQSDDQVPAMDFDDYRVLGLKDVLRGLGLAHPRRLEVIAAAARADRSIAGRATAWREPLSGAATSDGHTLWQVAERRAVSLYRHAAHTGLVDEHDPALESALIQRGGGEPLTADVRGEMERELGISLANVRVHTDATAARAARALDAEAFTVGGDIFFAQGAFAPDTRAGRKLIAHELAHVAQAVRGETGPRSSGLRISQPGEPLEREAEMVAERVDRRPDPLPTPSPAGRSTIGRPANADVHPAEPFAILRNKKPATPPAVGVKLLPGEVVTAMTITGSVVVIETSKGRTFQYQLTESSLAPRNEPYHASGKQKSPRVQFTVTDAIGDIVITFQGTDKEPSAETLKYADAFPITVNDGGNASGMSQRDYLANLPPQVAALLKVGIKGRPLTPADDDRLFRIAKRIEGMPPGQASDYASKITASTDDLATFEAALDAYATEMTARGKQDEQRHAVQLKLAGLEGLYQTYRNWKQAVAADAQMAAAAGQVPAGVGPLMMPSLSTELANQLDAQVKANGFASIGEFVGFIDKFTASFEQGAAVVAKDYLDKYSGYLYRQQERYSDPGETAALYQALAPFRGDYDDFQKNAAIANKWVAQKRNDVPGNWQQTYGPDAVSDDVGKAAYTRASQAKAAAQADLGALARQHPIFNEDGLAEDKRIDKVKLATASQDRLGAVVQAQIAQRAGDIAAARGELTDKPSVIYKMTKLFPEFYAQMGISPGSIYDMIIQDKMHEDAIAKLVGGILLAIIGIALAVISGGTAAPAVVAAGAGIAGAGLSAYMVYDQYEEYVQEKHLAGAGLADDPSVAWLVVAIVGAGLDMGAAAKAVGKLGAAAKALDAGGELVDFSKAVEALQQAGEIDTRIAAATERAAAARKAFSAASEDLSRALAKVYSLPGPFADPEVYKALVKMAMAKIRQGMAHASIWIDELRAARTVAKLGEMAPDELAAVKKAWEEAAKREGRRAALSMERGVTLPKYESEADSVLQAEAEAKVVGEARRTDPSLGEPNLDFRMTDAATGKPLGYVDVKAPVDPGVRPLTKQADNIADKVKSYDPDVDVIIDLKNLNVADKVKFLSELGSRGVTEGGRIKVLNK